jgi:hypothetical protein
MSRSKLALAVAMLVSTMGFVCYPQDSANAARFCAQLRGGTVVGHPDCSLTASGASDCGEFAYPGTVPRTTIRFDDTAVGT